MCMPSWEGRPAVVRSILYFFTIESWESRKERMAIFNWTGNPWVDTGLAVAVVRADKKSPEEMALEDFKKVIGDGNWLAQANEHLNAYICLFANAFLNRQVKTKDRPVQREKYRRILQALVNDLERSLSVKIDLKNFCECTGVFSSANKTLTVLTEQFRKERILKKDQRLDIGRNAFPLLGSITNDAGALPSASREPQLSAFALLCVQLTSLAAIMWKGKIACFQYTEPSLMIPHVKRIYHETTDKVNLISQKNLGASIAPIGTGKGSKSLALILLNELEQFKNDLEIKELPQHVALNIWLVINSGTNCDCEVMEIPNAALNFLWEAAVNFPDEIKGLLKRDKGSSILDSIEGQIEYMPFYPIPHSKPIPVDLLKKAKSLLSEENQKKAESGTQEEESEFTSLIQATIVDAAEKKQKKGKKADESKEKTKPRAKKTILQLLNDELKQKKKAEVKDIIEQINETTSKPVSKELFALYQINILHRPRIALATAEWIAYNLKERLKSKKEIKQLERFTQYLGDSKDVKKCRGDMRSLFADFAEDEILSYEQYAALFPIVRNQPISVDSFGWRYIWFYLNHEHLNSAPPRFTEEDRMSIDNQFRRTIKLFAKDVFEGYVEKHGEAKFKRVILDGFRNNKIKDQHLQQWFCNLAEIPGKEKYTNEAWDDLCRDENGTNRVYEVRFQLRLELANLYRQYITK